MSTVNQVGVGLSGASGTGSFAGTTSPTITTAVLNGTVSGTSVSTSSSASTLVLRDSNQNAFANNFISKATNIVSGGTTTILTSASARLQNLTGSSAQTFQLPDATTLSVGYTWYFNNNSSGTLSIVDNGSNPIATVVSGGQAIITAIAVATTNGAWDSHFLIPLNGSWGTAGLTATGFITASTTLTATAGIVASGASTGGFAGQFQAYSTTSSLGSLSLTAANNAGNYANVLTNTSTSAARTWTLPDASGTLLTSSGAVTSITGTANQVIASASTGPVTLSLPQSIATTSNVTFGSLTTTNMSFDTTANSILTTNTNGNLLLNPNGSGIVNIGSVGPTAGFGTIQVTKSAAVPSATLGCYSASTTQAGTFLTLKSHSTTVGAFSAVVNTEQLGKIQIYGDDGAAFRLSSQILAIVDGSVSSGIVPGALQFFTSNSSGTSTLALNIRADQSANFQGAISAPSITFSSTSGVIGTTTNDSAAAGSVGEFVTSVIGAPGTAYTSGVSADLTSISLTAGDWDVWASITFYSASGLTTFNIGQAWINTTSNTPVNPSLTAQMTLPATTVMASGIGVTCAPQRFSLSGTTTVYLTALSYFATNALTVNGFISARRRR